jgi:sterol desaturase/sphingolipid hydroxylase (fatty acid hydroxylase superfamily)
MKKNADGSPRMFEADWMEWFSHVHPATPALLWGPLISWLLWRSVAVHSLSIPMILALGFSGFFVWTLAEYLLHRFIFHYEHDSWLGRRMHFILHGVHHEAPTDATRLVMPPFAAVCLALILYIVFRALLGPAYVEPFFALFLVGYLCYDYIHYYVHRFIPRGPIGRFLKQSHMQHHYVSPNSRWGVSSPLWDYVFGTYDSEKARERA